jgi:hypothetical protein
MLSNISSLVNTQWYLGTPPPHIVIDPSRALTQESRSVTPPTTTSPWPNTVKPSNLAGLLVGQQPDVYSITDLRPYTYSPSNYNLEFGQLVVAEQFHSHR